MQDLELESRMALVLCDEVPRPPARWERVARHVGESGAQVHAVRGLALTTTLAILLWTFGVAWLSPWVVGFGLVQFVASTTSGTVRAFHAERMRGPLALPLAIEVEPREIAAIDLRILYVDALRLHEEIRRSLIGAPRMQTSMRDVFARCGDVVRVAGQLGRLANPVHRYLDSHQEGRAKAEVARLAAVAGVSSDPSTIGVYHDAAAARGRQLGTLLEIQGLRDRIRARLELIVASLESVAALVIKLQVLDLEQIDLVVPMVSEQLATLGEELAVLDTALDDAD